MNDEKTQVQNKDVEIDEKVRRKTKTVRNNITEIEKRADDCESLSLFGVSAMAFPDKISSVRGIMASRHVAQRVVLSNPEFARIYTGAENPFGERSSWNIKAKDDYQLMRIFRKFKDTPCSPIAYIMRNVNTGKYKCEVIKPSQNIVEKYGFRMYNNIESKYNEGDLIHKGSVIAQSSSYVNNNYCGGRNLRIGYATLPELTEDALIISEDCAEKLRYDMVDIVTVNINKNSFLLNKYGDNTLYKPFPDIGEEIQHDILCSIRENSYLSSIQEAAIPHINDKNYFSHGIVVDIDIFSNVEVENDQYQYYHKQITDWYSDIYSYISTIIHDIDQDDTTLLDIYHQAEKYLNESTWVTKEYIADTIMKFTILQPMEICEGQKVVGRYGNKSVITKIMKTELMPHTDDGRPLDVLANSLSIPNRIIAFATYESKMTFQMERIHQHIIELDKQGVSHDEIMLLVSDFMSIFNPDNGSEIMRLYNEYPNECYNDIIKNGLYIQIQPLNEVCIRDALIEADEKYADILKGYNLYTKLRHRWIKSPKTYNIGYQYHYVLKQEPSKAMSGVATGRTTLYDLPVKTRQFAKNLRRYSDNTIRFGEYDTFNLLSSVGVKSFAKITTYFRGSQYEKNSILMSQLDDVGVDTSKYNKFPQLSQLHNCLKLMGIEPKPDIFSYNTIGTVDEEYKVMINNNEITITIPELRYILMIHSYYIQYEMYMKTAVDMTVFITNIINTNLFIDKDDEFRNKVIFKFIELLPELQQMKQYE